MHSYGILRALFAFIGMILFPVDSNAGFIVSYTTFDSTQLFGGDATTGDTVSFLGSSGAFSMPFGIDSGAYEIQVGQLSITTHLTRDLPHGFDLYDFPLVVDINGQSQTLDQQLMLNIDQSNDSATLFGGTGTTAWNLPNGMTVEFQFITRGTPAANDGETTSVPIIAQFYGELTPVPEPSSLTLLSIGMLVLFGCTRRKRKNLAG